MLDPGLCSASTRGVPGRVARPVVLGAGEPLATEPSGQTVATGGGVVDGMAWTRESLPVQRTRLRSRARDRHCANHRRRHVICQPENLAIGPEAAHRRPTTFTMCVRNGAVRCREATAYGGRRQSSARCQRQQRPTETGIERRFSGEISTRAANSLAPFSRRNLLQRKEIQRALAAAPCHARKLLQNARLCRCTDTGCSQRARRAAGVLLLVVFLLDDQRVRQ